MSRVERALAELVGGHEGGWALFLVGLMRLDLAASDLRQFDERFRAHPESVWNRLLVLVDEALRTCELAVDLENALAERADVGDDARRREDIAELLLGRARALADEQLHASAEELSGLQWRPSPR